MMAWDMNSGEGWYAQACVCVRKLGAGKTSLAFPLAAELGYSLVTKDLVKETLHDVGRSRRSR